MFRILLLAALSVSSLLAQTTTSRIRGAVTDSTGAIVPGAEVTILHEPTGLKRSVLSTGSGQ